MMRFCFGFILFLSVFAGPASAQVVCTAPFLPVVPDGATASEEQINAARDQVMIFVRDSEDYQNCLVTTLRQTEAEAARDEDEVVDPQVRRTINARLEANRSHLTRVGDEFNAAARAYNGSNFPEEDQDDPAIATPPES